MISRLLYYLVIKPLSILPFWFLYGLSDVLYFVLYRCLNYRKLVVRTNLENSFPHKTTQEIGQIEKAFYSHFCDLIVESIRLFSISEKELKSRNILLNPELLDSLYSQNKSIILLGGHFNNWESGAAILSSLVKHHIIGIYAPLSNLFFNRKILKSRERFGMEMLSKKSVKEGFENHKHNLTATIFATDQSPTHSKYVHWTSFLNQSTAVLKGAERFAKDYDYPLVFVYIKKVKRGYYEIECQLLDDQPCKTKEGYLTETHTRWLENQIVETPQFWLWTHKRWKRKMKEGETFY